VAASVVEAVAVPAGEEAAAGDAARGGIGIEAIAGMKETTATRSEW
jgi:hypothetical protein